MKTILVDAVNTLVIKNELGQYVMDQELFKLLETYSNKKIVLTNADDKQFFEFNLHLIPYKVFTMEHNPNKNEPLYYQSFFNQSKLSAREVIYFEHNIDAIKSAQSVNINTFYFDKNYRNLEKLREFIDNNL